MNEALAKQYFKRKLASLQWRLLKAKRRKTLPPELIHRAYQTVIACAAWQSAKGWIRERKINATPRSLPI